MTDNDNRLAIVGMHVEAPNAPDLDSFWQIVRDGREAISFFGEDELRQAGVSAELIADPNFVAAGGVLPGIDSFDAGFFGISPHDAEIMDPQLRRFLEGAWSAFEAAGYDPRRIDATVGVYAGSASSTYLISNLLGSARQRAQMMRAGAVLQLNDRDALSTYVSYKLDLKGPSVSVQTMCSTSLVAVHMACQGLLAGECDMALAGGVSINVSQCKGYLWQEGLYLSPDGRTRAFDADARGTMFSSGLGIVVVKRLADAIADRDTIHAVILGSAVNNDGGAKAGFTAPSVVGQARVISEALAAAGVGAETIGYVEAHGTGTELGDVIEVEALTRAFRRHTAGIGFCRLGSAKSNFGHLDKAAGVIGLIKACLALRHKTLPPSVNFNALNPRIEFATSPFHVSAGREHWQDRPTPRRAGVSAFGIGGTNAHVVLEEAPVTDGADSRRARHLLTVSAHSAAALDAQAATLAKHLQRHQDARLADMAFTSHVGRTAFPFRRAIVAADREDAAAALARTAGKAVRVSASRPEVHVMFPGGGAQHPGMGRDLFAAEPVFRDELLHAQAIIRAQSDLDLLDLLFGGTDDPSASTRLDAIVPLQVTLFAVEHAMARLLLHLGITPSAMIGHSLGEYVAACIAGVFSVEDGLRLVLERGRLLGSLPKGAMLAVFLPLREFATALPERSFITAVNSDSSFVVSGPDDAIAALKAALDSQGIACHRLHVDAVSHCPLVESIVAPFRRVVASIDLRPPRIPFVSTLTGAWITADEATDPDYWAQHLAQPVRFADGLRTLLAAEPGLLIEAGPGHTLTALARERLGPGSRTQAVPSMAHPTRPGTDHTALLEALGAAWESGVAIDWENFHDRERLARAAMPGTIFTRRRYWIEPDQDGPMSPGSEFGLTRKPDSAGWLYLSAWRREIAPAFAVDRPADSERAAILVFADGHGPGEVIAARLDAAGHDTIVVRPGDILEGDGAGGYRADPSREDHYGGLFRLLAAQGLAPRKIVHCWSGATAGNDQRPLDERAAALVNGLVVLVRSFLAHMPDDGSEFIVVTSGIGAVEADDRVQPDRVAIPALCRVFAQEYPMHGFRVIDPGTADEHPLNRLMTEIEAGGHAPLVALRGPHRWVPAFEPIAKGEAQPPRPWRDHGVYLVTGGLGHIGSAIAEHILASVSATVVLLNRNPPDGDDDRTAARRARLDRLRQNSRAGGTVHVIAADASDLTQMRQAVAEIRNRFGGLHGVIHAAGTTDATAFKTVRDVSLADIEQQMRPKAKAPATLAQVLADVPEVEFCVLTSSLSSRLGGLRHAAYAAANAVMDGFARARADADGPRWISVDWEQFLDADGNAPQFDGEGRLGASLAELAIDPATAGPLLDAILPLGAVAEVAVSSCDLNRRDRLWSIGRLDAEAADKETPGPQHVRPDSASRYVAPRSAREQEIARIWAEVLGFEQVGIEDDFFALGGHSVSAIRIVSRLRNLGGTTISVPDLLRNPTVSSLSALCGAATRDKPSSAAAHERHVVNETS